MVIVSPWPHNGIAMKRARMPDRILFIRILLCGVSMT